MVLMQKLMVEVLLPMLPRRSNTMVIIAYFGCNIYWCSKRIMYSAE